MENFTIPGFRLSSTSEADLDFIESLDRNPSHMAHLVPWSRNNHLRLIAGPALHLVARSEGTGALIGYVVISPIDEAHRSAELIRLVVTTKRSGHGSALLGFVMRHVFETEKAHRLWLYVKDGNDRAVAFYQRRGLAIEGRLRECLRTPDGWESVYKMSILAHEFKGRRRSKNPEDPLILPHEGSR